MDYYVCLSSVTYKVISTPRAARRPLRMTKKAESIAATHSVGRCITPLTIIVRCSYAYLPQYDQWWLMQLTLTIKER